MSEAAIKLISEDGFIKNIVDEFSAALGKDSATLRNLIEGLPMEDRIRIGDWIDESGFEEVLPESSMIVPISKNLMLKNLPENEFYEKLFQFINFDAVNGLEEISIPAVLIMGSLRFPYHQKQLLEMSNEEYSDIVSELSLELSELSRILTLGYPQQTQIASAVLSILDKVEDKDKRIVLLACWNTMVKAFASGGNAPAVIEPDIEG